MRINAKILELFTIWASGAINVLLIESIALAEKAGGIAQVTSVSQLSDVQPTDWAFQALQSLVERYGCIAGYPDGTYRGNRALTRYEFAAGLNACLDRVNELIATATDQIGQEDLATLQKLQQEFADELATLRSTSNNNLANAIGLSAGQRSDRDVGLHIEAFYRFQLNDNISITPGVFWLTAPNHDDRNPDAVIGAIRTTFLF